MADNAELLQRIELLESLITADYTPPEGPECSFPVTGQGITSDQYRQMMKPSGTGVIHTGSYPYQLVKHDTDAETDSKNTLILKVDSVLGVGEAVIAGFFHRLTEDTEVSIPPVTVATTYHVCLTLDPAKEDDPAGPIGLEVYAGPPPTSGGKEHIIIATVSRQPSQVLSQATITLHRPTVSPVVSTHSKDLLPTVRDGLYGTIAVAGHGGRGGIYTYAGGTDWRDVLVGDWVDIPALSNGSPNSSNRPRCRFVPGGVQLTGQFLVTNRSLAFARLPAAYRPSIQQVVPVATSAAFESRTMIIATNGDMTLRYSAADTGNQGAYLNGVFFPID